MSSGSAHPDPGARSASANILGRWLHFGVALCIVLCLVLAGLAALATQDGHALAGTVAFNLHKFIGLNALLLLLLFLVWSALGHARAPADLFPWVSPRRLRRVAEELAGLHRSLHVPSTAAMVQGVGIALALVATATGLGLVLLSLAASGVAQEPAPFKGVLMAMHLRASAGLKVYLAIHVAAACVHAARGHTQRGARMFRLLSLD